MTLRWQFGRHRFAWPDAPRAPMEAADGPVLMGVLNATPDSFSDGGRFFSDDEHFSSGGKHLPADGSAGEDRRARVERAVEHALAMVAAGAHIVDIGGESSRPGAEPVPVEVELDRVVPVIEGLRARSAVCISVDTTKAAVARAAMAAGADVINDITALAGDPEMPAVAAETGAGVVLMHMRGTPRTMQKGDLSSPDIVGEVAHFLAGRIEAACAAGVARDAICVDPGIGFGKTLDQNLALIAGLWRLLPLGCPVLLGASRKSFLGALTDRPVEGRAFATAAACAIGVWNGAHVVRVHDVGEMRDVLRVAGALAGRVSGGAGRGR